MWFRGQDFAKELRRVRSEDQERILTELESRVCEQVLALRGTPGVQEVLEESLYRERRRLKDDGGHSPAYEGDQAFWEQIQRSIRHASDRDLRMLLRRSIRHYGEEIAGNFDPRVYKVATRILPSGLSVLMNAMSPKRLFTRLPEFPSIEDSIMIGGATEEARRLHEQGTVILVPTHVSNLDSIVVGYALYQLGLPPFIYGAGLNLFTNPLLSFFMHNLGAYTVDRKKSDPLYKEVLKHYATLTLEFGYDNIFFPGGTRSRSGAIERRLKYGLLGTGVQAYINNLQRKRERPKLFIVPMTLSFDLVLEAETLIDDFLKEVGKARYIIDDDEFAQPKRVFEFVSKLVSLNSKLHVTLSSACDVFGNPVNPDGESLDPCGRTIDISRYVLKNGEPAPVADRDAEYTREVGQHIMKSYLCDNVVSSTHVVARALFGTLLDRNPRMDVLRVLRTGGQDDDIELSELYRATEGLLNELKARQAKNEIRLAPSLSKPAEDVVADALALYSTYHTRPAARRRGDRVVAVDRTLLLYYQNRVEGYGLPGRPALSADHRSLAQKPA